MRTDAQARACPRCGSPDAIRIIYGLPDHELFAASKRGEVALGGCVIGDESPDFECRACGAALPYAADDESEDLAPPWHLAHHPRGNLATHIRGGQHCADRSCRPPDPAGLRLTP